MKFGISARRIAQKKYAKCLGLAESSGAGRKGGSHSRSHGKEEAGGDDDGAPELGMCIYGLSTTRVIISPGGMAHY